MIVFHGDSDPIVAVANDENVVIAHLSAAGMPTRKADRESAVATRIAPTGRRAYTRTVPTRPDGTVVAEVWIVHGGGHAWFGGAIAGRYTEPLGPDASAEMVRFFLDHRAEGRS